MLLDKIDLNNDGKIDFPEFVHAAVNHQELLNNKNLQDAFNLIDQNGDG